MRCDRSGREYPDFSDGIWDDDEWISWDYINSHIDAQERQVEFPAASSELISVFDSLVDAAIEYKSVTGRYLAIFGELGELYAEIKFGIRRHRQHAAGSDGRLENDFVEVKTITPDKRKHKVHVKRAGHFSKLVVVKISPEFEFEARMIDRSALAKGRGGRASISWNSIPSAKNPTESGDT